MPIRDPAPSWPRRLAALIFNAIRLLFCDRGRLCLLCPRLAGTRTDTHKLEELLVLLAVKALLFVKCLQRCREVLLETSLELGEEFSSREIVEWALLELEVLAFENTRNSLLNLRFGD